MRLIPRHRHHHRSKAPRISISQAEITADLVYPASPRSARERGARRRAQGGPLSGEGVARQPDGTAQDVAEAFAEANPEIARSRELVWQDPVPTAAAGATMTGMEYMKRSSPARCRRRRSR